MVQMFGVMPNNPDSWLQEKGQEVGREVMGKLMQSVYQADGMEPPADAIGAFFRCDKPRTVPVPVTTTFHIPCWFVLHGIDIAAFPGTCALHRDDNASLRRH